MRLLTRMGKGRGTSTSDRPCSIALQRSAQDGFVRNCAEKGLTAYCPGN